MTEKTNKTPEEQSQTKKPQRARTRQKAEPDAVAAFPSEVPIPKPRKTKQKAKEAQRKHTCSGSRQAGDKYQDATALDILVPWLANPGLYQEVRVEDDTSGFNYGSSFQACCWQPAR